MMLSGRGKSTRKSVTVKLSPQKLQVRAGLAGWLDGYDIRSCLVTAKGGATPLLIVAFINLRIDQARLSKPA